MVEGLVSVIVPVYNVEKYLESCVESILDQSYTNLEVILVNDGSPDKSPLICEKLKNTDSRVIVINKENGGLPSARNAGLDAAKGEYIGFVDSDDTIDNEMYNKMVSKLSETGADICMCGYNYIVVDDGYSLSVKPPPKIDMMTSTDMWMAFIDNFSNYSVITAGLCCKLIRSKLIKDDNNKNMTQIRQQENYIGDDGSLLRIPGDTGVAFACDCIAASTKVAFVENAYYNYMIRTVTSKQNASMSVFASDNSAIMEVLLEHLKNSMMSVLPNRIDDISRVCRNIKIMSLVSHSHNSIIRNLPNPKLLRLGDLVSLLFKKIAFAVKMQAIAIYFLPRKFYISIFKIYVKAMR